MRLTALAIAFLCLTAPASAFAQGVLPMPSGPVNGASAQAGPKAPRAVGSGVTMVPGTAAAAPASRPPREAMPATPASAATATQLQTAASAPAQLLDRREEFIKRSVMQSICRGC
jgi:hypothetical protein